MPRLQGRGQPQPAGHGAARPPLGALGDQPPAAGGQDPPQPRRIQPAGRRPSAGSASAATWAGRSLVPWPARGHGPWGAPRPAGLAGGGKGPRNSARAALGRRRRPAGAGPQPGRGRAHLDAWSAPAAPPASTAARCWSQWPPARCSWRNTSTRSARTPTASPVRSRASSSSTAAVSLASRSGRSAGPRLECVFDSMAATYQVQA
jgi:hypothetical protein